MAHVLSGGLNLRNCKGAKRVKVGGIDGIWIPFQEAHIVSKDKGDYLNIILFPHKDKYGHDYMCVRKKTREELANKTNTEIFGSFSSTGDSGYQDTDTDASVEEYTPPPSVKEPKTWDDDPF